MDFFEKLKSERPRKKEIADKINPEEFIIKDLVERKATDILFQSKVYEDCYIRLEIYSEDEKIVLTKMDYITPNGEVINYFGGLGDGEMIIDVWKKLFTYHKNDKAFNKLRMRYLFKTIKVVRYEYTK